MDQDGIATVINTRSASIESLQRAARSCPAGAIRLSDELAQRG
jgi:ferredoxin